MPALPFPPQVHIHLQDGIAAASYTGDFLAVAKEVSDAALVSVGGGWGRRLVQLVGGGMARRAITRSEGVRWNCGNI